MASSVDGLAASPSTHSGKINELPDEILLVILCFVIGDFFYFSGMYERHVDNTIRERKSSILLVCKRWDAIITSTSNFWRDLDLRAPSRKNRGDQFEMLFMCDLRLWMDRGFGKL